MLLPGSKNKPGAAPGSGDGAGRLMGTGKPATKAGRCPRLGISGALSAAAPLGGNNPEKRAFGPNDVLLQLLKHIQRSTAGQNGIKSCFVYLVVVSLAVLLRPSVAFSHTNKGALSAKSRENRPDAVTFKMQRRRRNWNEQIIS